MWNNGKRWVVATERGGRGYNNPIFAYDLSADSNSATLVQERTAFPPNVCEAATDLLKAVPQSR
jgi:hypothetical protein